MSKFYSCRTAQTIGEGTWDPFDKLPSHTIKNNENLSTLAGFNQFQTPQLLNRIWMHKTPKTDKLMRDSLEGTGYDLTTKETSLPDAKPLMMSDSRKCHWQLSESLARRSSIEKCSSLDKTLCKSEPKIMHWGWYLRNKELKPCVMMDLLSLWVKGGTESCSWGDAAQSSQEERAGGRSSAGFASRWQWYKSSKSRTEPAGDGQNNFWRMSRLAGFSKCVLTW